MMRFYHPTKSAPSPPERLRYLPGLKKVMPVPNRQTSN